MTNAQDERKQLAAVRAAARQGDLSQARRLIHSVLRDNPNNEMAWSWACEVAATPEERIHCLQQILTINPNHVPARRYLARLQATPPATRTIKPLPSRERSSAKDRPPSQSRPSFEDRPPLENTAHGLTISNLLFAPIGCLLQASATHLIAAMLIVAVVGGIVYYTANTDFLGLAGPGFETLTISSTKEEITSEDVYWKITYEKKGDSEFSGLVRHVSPIRDNRMRILTHDILVTSGEYADPALVRTSVSNHHFRWRSTSTAPPTGTINLLHTVPADDDIYRHLLEVRSQDEVIISGREILSIQAYNQAGNYLGEWHDTGCNTLLVESVTILDQGQVSERR